MSDTLDRRKAALSDCEQRGLALKLADRDRHGLALMLADRSGGLS